ncbi:MAG: tetratricopeptide repeat protein [Halopseudomonas sp.]
MALSELALMVAGVQSLLVAEDPYVGFSNRLDRFERQPSQAGDQMVLKHYKGAIFNNQQFPADKSPNSYRIFCLGGSTTHGRPYDYRTAFCGWLEAFLQSADPSKDWQVINVGGISYASYRVAAMMTELNNYQPDMYIVYSGHNEFLEERTYREIVNMPEWMRDLSTELSRSRIYSVMKRSIRSFRSTSESADAVALQGEVDEILTHSVGPKSYQRDENNSQAIQSHYRYNMERMIRLAESSNSEILFIQPAAKLHQESPFKSSHRDGISQTDLERWQMLFNQAKDQYQKHAYAGALASIDKALTLDDRHAESHYWRGKILFSMGNYAQARIAYQRSSDEDIAPLRILSSMQQALHQIATENRATLIDFPAIIADISRQRFGHDLPGEKLFLDHVHPTIEMHKELGLALFDQLKQQGLATAKAEWNAESIANITDSQLSLVDQERQRSALHNLASVTLWSGKNEEAYAMLLRSQEEFGNTQKTLTMLAEVAQRLGKKPLAQHHAYQATELYPDNFDNWYFLASLYKSNEQFAEAVQTYRRGITFSPEHIELHQALSLLLINTGRSKEAIKVIENIVELDPNLDEAFINLGILYAETGQLVQSERNFQQSIRLNPEQAYAYTGLATVYERRSMNYMAYQYFKKAQLLDPTDPEIPNSIGSLLARSGKLAQAIEQFETALNIDPSHAEAKRHLQIARSQLQTTQPVHIK